MNILIVDDEPKIRKGLRHVIDWYKYNIHIAGSVSDGEEAYNLITSYDSKIDIVITDVQMPKMDGIELSKQLQKSYPGIKIIILSGYDNFSYAKEAMKYGVTNYLLKPVDEDELLETVLNLEKQIENRNYSYPKELEVSIIEHILNFESKELSDNIYDIFSFFDKERYTLTQIKGSINLLFLNIENKLLPDGVTFYDISNNNKFEISNLSSTNEIMLFFSKCINTFAEHKSISKSSSIMNQIKCYMRENLNSDLSLSSVSKEFLLNSSYLSQLFKKHYNGGFSSYLVDLKIEKAIKLLHDKNLKISEVSELVGYNDVKYFSKLFKNKTGMRPSEFRVSIN